MSYLYRELHDAQTADYIVATQLPNSQHSGSKSMQRLQTAAVSWQSAPLTL